MKVVLPGGTIGILGGGQLARMMALEARRMGYHIAVLDPQPNGPAAQVSDYSVTGSFDDPEAAERLAGYSDVITLDTEHVPADLLERLERLKPVRPSSKVLRIIQDRLEQRRFLDKLGAPVVRYAPVWDQESLHAAAASVGFPCVLKTRRSGYDGRGQIRVDRPDRLEEAWREIRSAPAVMETFVDFDREISVLLARGLDGEIRFHAMAENRHRRHILHLSRVPARASKEMARHAEELGARIAGALGHVGMMAVEMFVTRQGGLLVNEIAPRTHNSGHYSFGACATSQFEQHVRAVCGLPLGDPSLLSPAVMLNLLGDLWASGEPPWEAVLAHPSVRLHLYGKKQPWPGRKMGHILVLDQNPDRAWETAEAVAAELERAAAVEPEGAEWIS